MSKYHLPEGYVEQTDNFLEHDDRPLTDEWQDEVYRRAKEIALAEKLSWICDYGCGSGFKLMKYFADFYTVGIDTPQTVDFLKEKYPGRTWAESVNTFLLPDMVICADVLEHVENPDDVMALIRDMHPSWIVLSTPERDIREEPRLGPPGHRGHYREWNMTEFKAYVEDWFTIVEGPMIFAPQYIQQMVVCKIK
jgi:hypothetical protein